MKTELRTLTLCALFLTGSVSQILLAQDNNEDRAREAGLVVGVFQPGELNAITDVEGVRAKLKPLSC